MEANVYKTFVKEKKEKRFFENTFNELSEDKADKSGFPHAGCFNAAQL